LALAIFDLDNTLISGDSDYLWGVFLGEQGIVDKKYYTRENERFYEEYKQGTLDIFEFLEFSLKPLADHPLPALLNWRQEFIESKIKDIIPQASYDLIAGHRDKNDTLMIITATNAFVTRPIADLLGIEILLATEPELINNQYTGKVEGEPTFQQGKVSRLDDWLKKNNATLEGSYFYSDSRNDIPLLEKVDHPVAVDPDDMLRKHAEQRQWPIISLRGESDA
jgi:HAD superfamily hydrolase (TIGR01490 family)